MTTSGADSAYAGALEALARVLVDDRSLRGTLDQLLEVTSLAVPDVTALTVTAVGTDGSITAAAWNDPRARVVDELEYALREGPCIAALETGQEQLVRDTGTDTRWPRFAERAAEEGFATVAGLPLSAPDGTTIGALNVFASRRDGLSEGDLTALRRVRGPAAVLLANARAFHRTRELSEHLASTLDERAVVHRAVGAILARSGGTPEDALARIEATAEREQVDARTLAERVLAGEVTLP